MGTAGLSPTLPTANLCSCETWEDLKLSKEHSLFHPTERGLCKLYCNSSLLNICRVARRAASSSLCFGATLHVQLPAQCVRVESDQPCSEELAASWLCLILGWPQLSCVHQALEPGEKTSQGRWAGTEPPLPLQESALAAGKRGWGRCCGLLPAVPLCWGSCWLCPCSCLPEASPGCCLAQGSSSWLKGFGFLIRLIST